ncbi:MAG: hypothetical protein NPIRA02_40320 [Nitrospirales bacterium]|nr:MAG: hypothetical protein NPIRA02_40320 [Nitrospirales bacterium]
MARNPLKRISYSVCFHNEEEQILFEQLGCYYDTKTEATKHLKHLRKAYPHKTPFLVKVTEERMKKEG